MRKTVLHDVHRWHSAKMGEFAGYEMPLYYREGVIKEHEWVRSHAGIFDVSHMGQVIIEGPEALSFLEHITPSSFQKKKPGRAQYTVLTNEDGGIVDDLIVTRMAEDKFFAVLNAGCKGKDIDWIKSQLPVAGLHLYHMDEHALIALQGPWAEQVLYEVIGYDAHELLYMHMVEAVELPLGAPVFISRLGYTGEDGFEISIHNDFAADLWDKLLEYPEVKPIGLAARDSLRLEMGYPLYGHDIDTTTSPLEADLGWLIGKSNTSFIGAQRTLSEREKGIVRKRVGIKLLGKGVAREGAEIRNLQDERIGALTSGGFSPTLKESIGQGYVQIAYADVGEEIFVNVRGRNIEAQIAALPFVEPKTKSMKKAAA